MPIRTKFLIVFFITSLLPLIFLAYVNFSSAQQKLTQDTQEKLEIIADLQTSRIRETGMKSSLLTAIASDYTGLGSTGEIMIGRRAENGTIAFITPSRFKKSSTDQSPLMTEALNKHEGFLSEALDYRGKSVVAVTRYIPDLRLGVVVKIDSDEAFRSISALRDVIVLFSFIFTLVIVTVTLFFVHSITAPVLNLVSVAKQVRLGDLSKRALILSKDEIGELSRSFNDMIAALQESHKNLERKVAERTEQLEASNKDLEGFAYSVSHDLKAPLRSIEGFSQILEEDHSGKLDDEGKRVITTIRTSTKQMATLIDDLLSFSRLGRQEIKMADVDMTALAKTVFDEFKLVNQQRSIQFTCDDLPPAHVDPVMIRQVWVNLLSNAIKFTGKKDNATITIASKVTDKDNIYYIKDNGAGFDMKYVAKLFGVFQRLHDSQDFEGTGIGLSLVARIVKKHGGNVWAEGVVGQGATFYFSLPKQVVAKV
jgi:signal transduction histidine kinase